ncbi:hypothetical protein EDB85DRAFT_1865382 [Lactarius pseudohatsudake]|nr:hypothetical protein EDB85DRAFT_1865382 [Lactarius pseudohatsudake]
MCGQTEVRKFAMTLLKRKNKQSPFRLPSRKEFARFEKRMKGGPTRKNFRVQLTGSLACRWNCRAADVFSKAYIKKYKSRFKHEDLVACFKTHLRTLKNQHERIEAGPTKTQMDIERCSTSARRTRRQGLARRRGEVLEAYEELQEIAPHLNKLRVDGMSGDESDHSGGHRRYVVRKLDWRSDEVTFTLRSLDALALVSHWTSDGRPRPGKFPHVRTISDKVENRDPVCNLPRNFYAKDWLDQLDQYERRELNIRKPMNLTFPNRLLRCVTRSLRDEAFLNIVRFRLANRYKDASDPQRPPLPSGGAQNSASGSRGVRPSRQRHSGPSNAKRGRAHLAALKKSNRDGMDVDD